MRRFIFLLIILSALFFAVSQLAAQVTSTPLQGESGLSQRPWQVGVYVQGGFPPDYKEYFPGTSLYEEVQLDLWSAGFEVGKQTKRFDSLRPLRGRGEALLDVIPFWLARYPPQTVTIYEHGIPFTGTSTHWDGKDIYGTSITPFLLRWNFSQRDTARIVPWTQLGCGLLWTNHQFPNSGGTSVINFTPQVGAGVNIFNQPRHSINLAMKAIHYSNAGLGDLNPGVKLTFQFSAGYSWWR
jgi:hypothetical protein